MDYISDYPDVAKDLLECFRNDPYNLQLCLRIAILFSARWVHFSFVYLSDIRCKMKIYIITNEFSRISRSDLSPSQIPFFSKISPILVLIVSYFIKNFVLACGAVSFFDKLVFPHTFPQKNESTKAFTLKRLQI